MPASVPRLTNHGSIDTASTISGVNSVIARMAVASTTLSELARERASAMPPRVPSTVETRAAPTAAVSEVMTEPTITGFASAEV